MSKFYLFQGKEDHHFKSLKEQKLFFGYADSFNDPYDCLIQIGDDHEDGERTNQGHLWSELKTLLKKRYSQIGSSCHWDAYLIPPTLAEKIRAFCDDELSSDDLITALSAHIRSTLGIRCLFSDAPDSTLMWAHYANQHQGFCLELEKESGGNPPQAIRYATEPPNIYLSEFLFSSRNTLDSIFAHKHTCWAYENEWRIIDYNYDQKHEVMDTGFLANTRDIGYSIKAVIMGSSISLKNEEKLKIITQKIDVKLKKMSPHSGHSWKHDKLTIKPVS